MRLFSFLSKDGPALGVLLGDHVVRLGKGYDSLDLALTEERLPELRREAARRSKLPGVPVASLSPLPALEFPGKIVLIVLMFVGRLGPISAAVALSRQRTPYQPEYPEEEPLVG